MPIENLDGMSTEQLMLRDLIYEIPDLLAEAEKGSPEFRRGVFVALTLLEFKLNSFEIDQSRFAKQMPDIEEW